jgi:hypothetical protein
VGLLTSAPRAFTQWKILGPEIFINFFLLVLQAKRKKEREVSLLKNEMPAHLQTFCK